MERPLPPPPVPGRGSGVRWGLWDPLLVYLLVLVLAVVATSIALGVTHDDPADPGAAVTIAGIAGQFGGFAAGLLLVSRVKGRRRLRDDFGLRVRVRDWWAVPLGAVLAIVLALSVLPLRHLVDLREQEVVENLRDAKGVLLVVWVLTAGVMAPVAEEALFRGLLLRALLRRTSPTLAIAGSALIFGLVHLLSADPLATIAVEPALVGVGVVSGILAVRSGGLSQSILLHGGFNALTVLSVL